MPDQKRSRTPYVPPRNRPLAGELYAIAGQVGFFTVAAYGRSVPFTSAELNDAAVEILLAERRRMRIDLYAYCLMPEHLHILVCPREDGCCMLTFMDEFKGKSTRVSWAHGWHGKLWQKRSHDHLVRRSQDVLGIVRYIHDNPAQQGLATTYEGYRWLDTPDPSSG